MAYTQDIGRDFWFAFDKATQGTPSFMQLVGRSGAARIQRTYRDTRSARTYPNEFVKSVEAQRADWAVIAEVQANKIGQFFGNDWLDIQAAFEDFGQGTLLDTRPERGADIIHMMDTGIAPPIGYHRWHASIRAIQLLTIGDNGWWEKLDTLVGFAWAVQSLARPVIQQNPNLPLSQGDMQDLRNAWLNLSPSERDVQFDLPSGQFSGYHPSPKLPVA